MQGRTTYTRFHHTRARRGAHGFALIEVLAASVVLGLVGTSVMAGVFTLVRADSSQRAGSDAAVVARNYADALSVAPYQDCAATSAYGPDVVDLSPSTSATVTVDTVTYWDGTTAPPANANPTPAQWAAAFGSSCSVDTGLQRITFTVTSDAGGSTAKVTRSVLKRFNGSLTEPPPDPPPGGRKCVIVASGNVADTWVNETAGKQNTNYSTGTGSDELNILYLSGTRRFSYLRFDIKANMSCDNGVTLPTGATIVAAEVQLYTFNIGGLPACGANSCWHVMERVPATWNQSTLTWANQPCPTGLGVSCQAGGTASTILFEHGTGALDWSPRYQRIQATQLLNDVRDFYASPSSNYGWVIKEACAITYGKACGSATPGFQMRSSRAGNTTQRPMLTVFF